MGIASAIIMIVLVLAIGVFVMTVITFNNNDCFKEIAENYCEDQGMSLDRIYLAKTFSFSCKEDERSMNREVYRFLEDEIEECKEKK